MEKEKAKEFIFVNHDGGKIFISKDLQKLIDMNEGNLVWIYAVIETSSGETLMQMDWSYSGEPIIMRRFIHKAYYLKYYCNYKVIKI